MSSSAPVLTQEDYQVPCHGAGDTGPAKRVTHGAFSKDTGGYSSRINQIMRALKNGVPSHIFGNLHGFGEDTGGYSSRINQIMRAATKTPGPGKYLAHEDWRLNGGSKFLKGDRSFKPMHKNPDPTHYERKDFFQYPSNRGKECLSQNRRQLYGNMTKGNRRSFLDGAVRHGKSVPAPGHYNVKQKANNKLDNNPVGALNWKVSESNNSSGGGTGGDTSLAPNHYSINYNQVTDKQAVYSVPKEKASNFLDKVVMEKWVDVRSKKEMPGPGTYKTFDGEAIDKTTRGTYQLQLRTLSRSATSGYF